MRARSWLVVGIATAAALLLLGRAVTTLVVEHAWFTAMGVPSLWWERATDSVLLQGGAWVVGSCFAFANLYAVRRTIRAVAVPSRVANIELTSMIPGRRLLGITIALAGLVGLALAAPLSDWTQVAMARHGIAFGEIEGFLDRDLGFYVYWLPLEETLYVWALVSVMAVGTMVIVLYTLTRSLRLDGRRVYASSHVRRHLSALGALVLLLLAWSYRLDSFDLLRYGSGPDGLFLRVDHMVTLRVDLFMTVLCSIAALILLRAGWMSQLRLAFFMFSVVLAGALGLRHVLPALIARGDLLGEPAKRDLDYLATRTLFSRRAFDVDGIRTTTPDSLPKLATRLRTDELPAAVSLWDASSLQARANGDGRVVVPTFASWTTTTSGALGALIVRQPSGADEPWSLIIVDATQPVLRDSAVSLRVAADDEAPLELAVAPGLAGHAMMTDPTGTVLGTSLRTLSLRVAHAWAARDPSLLDGVPPGEDAPVFVSQRDVRHRLALLAPVFAQGREIAPLLHDGTLYWTVQLYSASNSYPLSQQWQLADEVRSYFRLAATALVDATTGRVQLVAIDRPDPVARSWMARAPSLFVRVGELPASLVNRLPPATDGAMAQLRTFARYGSRLEGAIPRHLADSTFAGDGPSGHLVRADTAQLVAWSAPLLDAGDQLGGVITAVGGRFRRTYWDSTTVPRPRWSALTEQLRATLDSTRTLVPDGSRREPRMRPAAPQVIMGERGPVVVQTLRWNRTDGSSVVSRVAVLDEGRIGVGATLAEADARLGSPRSTTRSAVGGDSWAGEPRDVLVGRLYDAMRQALRSGSWTKFGAAFDSLGSVLGKPPQ